MACVEEDVGFEVVEVVRCPGCVSPKFLGDFGDVVAVFQWCCYQDDRCLALGCEFGDVESLGCSRQCGRVGGCGGGFRCGRGFVVGLRRLLVV